MSLVQIGEAIDVSQGALYRWLQGLGRPSVLKLDDMLGLFGYRLGLKRNNKALPAPSEDPVAWVPRRDLPADLHPLIVEVREVGSKHCPLTIGDAAKAINLSPSTLYGWLQGEGTPTVKPMDDLLDLCGFKLYVQRGVRPVKPAAVVGS